MNLLEATWKIPRNHIYVTFTEHKDEVFNLQERALANWEAGEDRRAGEVSLKQVLTVGDHPRISLSRFGRS